MGMAIGGWVALIGYELVQTWAGYQGIQHDFGSGWAVAALGAALTLRLWMPITVGAFFCALEIWGWHWAGALLFAAPGMLFMLLLFPLGGRREGDEDGPRSIQALALSAVVALHLAAFGVYWWLGVRSTPERTAARVADAMMARDWRAVYRLSGAPATVPEADFVNGVSTLMAGTRIVGYKIGETVISGNRASVRVEMTIQADRPPASTRTASQPLEERLVDGEWRVSPPRPEPAEDPSAGPSI